MRKTQVIKYWLTREADAQGHSLCLDKWTESNYTDFKRQRGVTNCGVYMLYFAQRGYCNRAITDITRFSRLRCMIQQAIVKVRVSFLYPPSFSVLLTYCQFAKRSDFESGVAQHPFDNSTGCISSPVNHNDDNACTNVLALTHSLLSPFFPFLFIFIY